MCPGARAMVRALVHVLLRSVLNVELVLLRPLAFLWVPYIYSQDVLLCPRPITTSGDGPSTIAGLDSLDWTGGLERWMFSRMRISLRFVRAHVRALLHNCMYQQQTESSMIMAESLSVASKVICLDNSPSSVPVSPVKPVSGVQTRVKCRKLLFDLRTESDVVLFTR